MKANAGSSVASSKRSSTAPPVGLLPPQYPSLNRADGVASAVPNASFAGKEGTLATIAQTKYHAPPGWSTPAGTKAEGIYWTKPDGSIVVGTAPAVFGR